jgi:2,4-dienoyl-CoA reductase-like NADH-dependent reductase (Old Yellow Enzyme family)/thioredoxin reductase
MMFEKLLSSAQIGTMKLRNRFVVPAMNTHFGNFDSTVSQQQIDYYATRAKGGFGLIVTEFTAIDPRGKASPREIGVWSDEFIPGLKKLVDEVHAHGAKIALQLHHGGRQTVPSSIGGLQPVAPSCVPCPLMQVMPHELSTEEVWDLVEKFGAAAARAKKIGFDAVEIHGAHGYLIAQFMSQYSNKRLDEFGGNFISRMKFPLEILKSVRAAVGADYPVLFRLSSDELVTGGRTIHETRAACMLLEQAGIDALDISICTYESIAWMCAPSSVPQAFNSSASEDIKHTVSVPVITVGRIDDPFLAESLLVGGKADFVALGRESIADPEIPNKVRDGRIDEIMPCLACLQGCLSSVSIPGATGQMFCVMNPFTGHEGTRKLLPTAKKKNVMVVGSGPGGLEAAWIAAKRGHSVTCYEKLNALGGQVRVGGIPPAKQELLNALRQLITLCEKNGVKFKKGVDVTKELVAAEKPDAVILATGATPLVPNIPGINSTGVVHAKDVIEGKSQVGQRVLVIGGGMVGAETADYLSEYRKQVTILEMLPAIAADVPMTPRQCLLDRLNKKGVVLQTEATVKEFVDGGVVYEKGGEVTRLTGFDHVVLALGARAFNPLEAELKGLVPEVYVLGDARKARRIPDATSEAADVALAV